MTRRDATGGEAAALTVAALDRMIESVEHDIGEQDVGNHGTIGFLSGELKGYRNARTYLVEAQARFAPSETGTLDMSEKARLDDAESDVLRLHAEKMKFFERVIELEREVERLSAPSATRPKWIPIAEKPTDDKFDGYYIGRDSHSGRPVGMTFQYPVDPDFYRRHMFDAVQLVGEDPR